MPNLERREKSEMSELADTHLDTLISGMVNEKQLLCDPLNYFTFIIPCLILRQKRGRLVFIEIYFELKKQRGFKIVRAS